MNDGEWLASEVEEFYKAYAGEVRGFLFNLCTPVEIVDEIVNDAFLAASRKWKQLRAGDPRAYVFKVASNQRRQRIKKIVEFSKRTVLVRPSGPWHAPRQLQSDHANDVVDRLTVQNALHALSERQCHVVVLRVIYDFSVADTAAILDVPGGTIKSDLHRAISVLAKLLGTAEEAKEQ